MNACKPGAIYLVDERASINQSICTECGDCIDACARGAIRLEKVEVQPTPQSIQESGNHEIAAALKSNVKRIGKTLLPLAITGIADLILSKIEKSDKPAGLGKKSGVARGKQMRQRRRRGRN